LLLCLAIIRLWNSGSVKQPNRSQEWPPWPIVDFLKCGHLHWMLSGYFRLGGAMIPYRCRVGHQIQSLSASRSPDFSRQSSLLGSECLPSKWYPLPSQRRSQAFDYFLSDLISVNRFGIGRICRYLPLVCKLVPPNDYVVITCKDIFPHRPKDFPF